MEFWIGTFIGFGVGSTVLACLMLWLMGKIIHGKNETNEKLFEYWATASKQQAEQVHMLDRIATVVEMEK